MSGVRNPSNPPAAKRHCRDGQRVARSRHAQAFQEHDKLVHADPAALLDLSVKVYWPLDDRWYPGSITAFNSVTMKHQVSYVDGDKEWVFVAAERLQLRVCDGDDLVTKRPANHTQLASLAAQLLEAANKRVPSGSTPQRAEAIGSPSDGRQAASELRALAARVQQLADARRRDADAGSTVHVSDSTQPAVRRTIQLSDSTQAAGSRAGLEAHHLAAQASSGGPAAIVQGAENASTNVRRRSAVQSAAAAGDAGVVMDGKAVVKDCERDSGAAPAAMAECVVAVAEPDVIKTARPPKPKSGRPKKATKLVHGPITAADTCAVVQNAASAEAAPPISQAEPAQQTTEAAEDGHHMSAAMPESSSPAASSGLSTGPTVKARASGSNKAVKAAPAAAAAAGVAGGGGGGDKYIDAAVEAEIGARLLRAHDTFLRMRTSMMQFREVDVLLRMEPEALVGRELRVLWPADAAWYCGRITQYHPDTAQHTVTYLDGSLEVLHMGAESVRVCMHAGEALQPPSADSLRRTVAATQRCVKQKSVRAALMDDEDEAAEAKEAVAKLIAKIQSLQLAAEQTQQAEATAAAESVRHSQPLRPCAPVAPPPPARSSPTEAPQCDSQRHSAANSAATCVQRTASDPNADAKPSQAGADESVTVSAVGRAFDTSHSCGAAAAANAAAAPGAVPGAAPSSGVDPAASVGPDDDTAGLGSDGMLPGEVVWVLIKGHPGWPALVTTDEDAVRAQVPGRRVGTLPVLCFGEFSRARVSLKHVVPLREAVATRHHAVRMGPKYKLKWDASLFEVANYLQDGELPAAMVPWNNDNVFEQDDDVDGAMPADAAGGKGKKSAAAKQAPSEGWRSLGDVKLPLKLSSAVTLLCVGRIEFISPHFHNEKYIFPVGYAAQRTATTPASGNLPALHLMEIVAGGPGDTEPRFRITPQGGSPIEAATPTHALQRLWDADPTSRAKALQRSGHDMFGLNLDAVQRLVQWLPGAVQCERFCGWASGERPVVPPLSALDQLRRRAVLARSAVLPPHITAVPRATLTRLSLICDVCGEEDEEDVNLMLTCDACGVCVHQSCYGVADAPNGTLWLCDGCKLCQKELGEAYRLPQPPCCELCPVKGGALKPTAEGRWAHLMCAVWVPETIIGDVQRMEPICGISTISAARRKLLCSLCKQPHGACIQCHCRECFTAMHPMCAREAGWALPARSQEEDSGDDEGQAHDGAAAAPATAPVPVAGGAAASIPALTVERQNVCSAAGRGAGGVGGTWRDGVAAPMAAAEFSGRTGAGIDADAENRAPHTTTHTTKHTGKTPAPKPPAVLRASSSSAARSGGGGGRSGARRPLLDAGSSAGEGFLVYAFCPKHRHLMATDPQLRLRWRSRASAAAPEPLPAASSADAPSSSGRRGAEALWCGAVRCLPLGERMSRGARAPETLARGMDKRRYVKPLPYIVTGRLRGPLLPSAPAMFRDSGPEFDDQAPSTSGLPAHALPSSPPALGREVLSSGFAGSQGSALQSAVERYRAMRASLSWRLTSGKSAIHGWGAFTKVPHKAGDFLIEYAGEVVRHSLSDLRERLLYNKLVGAGTYVFRLDAHLAVDATRAGNMAHLLNHSCEPSCLSRTVTLAHPDGSVRDHILILAARDLKAGEELTYDYRFGSTEKLPCNCGAPRCRRFVNYESDGPINAPGNDEAGLWVPRHMISSA